MFVCSCLITTSKEVYRNSTDLKSMVFMLSVPLFSPWVKVVGTINMDVPVFLANKDLVSPLLAGTGVPFGLRLGWTWLNWWGLICRRSSWLTLLRQRSNIVNVVYEHLHILSVGKKAKVCKIILRFLRPEVVEVNMLVYIFILPPT